MKQWTIFLRIRQRVLNVIQCDDDAVPCIKQVLEAYEIGRGFSKVDAVTDARNSGLWPDGWQLI